jgi:hypothetical protein
LICLLFPETPIRKHDVFPVTKIGESINKEMKLNGDAKDIEKDKKSRDTKCQSAEIFADNEKIVR